MTPVDLIIFCFWHLLAVTFNLIHKKIARNFVYSCWFGINFKMECKNEHFRHIFLFYFPKGKNAAQAAKLSRNVYGEGALKDRQCRNFFDKFRSGDFSFKDEQRSDRPNEVDDDQIKVIIEEDRHVTVREIEEILKLSKSTIERNIIVHYRSELWDHRFFDDCLKYLNFNSVNDEICTLNNVKAIKFIFKISLE